MIENLMIGDWVMVDGKPIQVKNIENFHINVYYGTDAAFCTALSKITPIPITKEILEKNGFYFGYTSNEEDMTQNTIAQLSQEDKGWVWDEGAGEIKVIFPNESNGGLINIDDQSFNRHLVFVFADVIYVHELQHALRLTGIDKEIIID